MKLLARINEGLAIVKANGTYDRLYERWFGVLERRRATWNDVVRISGPYLAIAGLAFVAIIFAYWRQRQTDEQIRRLNAVLERRDEPGADRAGNLLLSAWKFSSSKPRALIEFGREPRSGHSRREGPAVFFVRDDGAGFDPAYTKKLFGVFERLHRPDEFDGAGAVWQRSSAPSIATVAAFGRSRQLIRARRSTSRSNPREASPRCQTSGSC